MLATYLISWFSIFACAKGALTQVSTFGTNPSGIQMWIEVPSNVATNAPIIVAVGFRLFPHVARPMETLTTCQAPWMSWLRASLLSR